MFGDFFPVTMVFEEFRVDKTAFAEFECVVFVFSCMLEDNPLFGMEFFSVLLPCVLVDNLRLEFLFTLLPVIYIEGLLFGFDFLSVLLPCILIDNLLFDFELEVLIASLPCILLDNLWFEFSGLSFPVASIGDVRFGFDLASSLFPTKFLNRSAFVELL